MATLNAMTSRIRMLRLRAQDILDQMNRTYDRQLIRSYRRALEVTKGRIADLYERYADDPTFQKAVSDGVLPRVEAFIGKDLKGLLADTKRLGREAVKTNFEDAYNYAAYSVESGTGLDLGFSGVDPNLVKANVENPFDRIKWPDRMAGHVGYLDQKVKEVVTQSLIQGDGYSKTALAVKDAFERTTWEMQRIIATESHRAASAAEREAFGEVSDAAKELGLEAVPVWDATLDGKTRPDHRELDQQPGTLGEDGDFFWKFADGTITKGPGLSGVPAQDCNCRCMTYVSIDGSKPSTRRDQESREEIGHMTYEEWAESKGIEFKGQKFEKEEAA